MHENPLKRLRIASALLYFETHKQTEADKAEIQRLLTDLIAEAHKAGFKIEIVVHD